MTGEVVGAWERLRLMDDWGGETRVDAYGYLLGGDEASSERRASRL